MHKYVHVMICHCQGLSAAGVSLQSANFVGPHSIALIFFHPTVSAQPIFLSQVFK